MFKVFILLVVVFAALVTMGYDVAVVGLAAGVTGVYLFAEGPERRVDVPCDPREDMSAYNPKTPVEL